MRRMDRGIRMPATAGLALSASTLIALVAGATYAQAARTSPGSTTAIVMPMAVVMAVAAGEFAAPVEVPLPRPTASVRTARPMVTPALRRVVLDERVLDLPPPARA